MKTLLYCSAMFLSLAFGAPVAAATWESSPEGAFVKQLDAITAKCKVQADREDRARNQEGAMVDSPIMVACLENGTKAGKERLAAIKDGTEFKLDVNTVHLKWQAYFNGLSATQNSNVAAKRSYDFAVGALKAKVQSK
jgi:hypothetical protein